MHHEEGNGLPRWLAAGERLRVGDARNDGRRYHQGAPGRRRHTNIAEPFMPALALHGFAGNVILGGIVGMTIDAASGATLDHWPNPAVIVLQPLDPANPKTPIYSQPAPPPPTKPESRQPVS